MARANVREGVWERRIPSGWYQNGRGTTDIPSSLLVSTEAHSARFLLPDGTSVTIPFDPLRVALRSAPTRKNGTITGPFFVDVQTRTVNGSPVPMEIGSESVPDPDELLLSSLERDLTDEGVFNPRSQEDGRDVVLRAIIQRRGQQEFRKQLLDIYEGACAVTGWDVQEALEAAHIQPYRGSHTHHPQNGILLRADIHTLFDLHLLTVEPEHLEIRLSRRLLESEVLHDLQGKKLFLPSSPSHQPSREALAVHFAEAKKKGL